MDWTFVFMMGILKIPLLFLCWLVWWAIRQTDDVPDQPTGGDGGTKVRPPFHPRTRRWPRGPRRGPSHGASMPSPRRVRVTVARARRVQR